MEPQWISATLVIACLPILCLCIPLEGAASTGTEDDFGNSQSQFAAPHGEAGFQSWTDWLDKRSFGQFPFEDNFQAWKEWMDKRSLLYQGKGAQFGSSKLPAFQQWKDWMEKRGFDNKAKDSFKGMAPMGKAQFQTWTDWMSKRGFGGTTDLFKQPPGANFQSWAEYSKKSHHFGSTPDFIGGGKLQHWNTYKKRFGLEKPSHPFGNSFDAKPHLMKWDEVFKRKNDKRQLGSAPSGFGQYRPYFQDGLQDWRNTFQGGKRTTTDAKSSKQQSN